MRRTGRAAPVWDVLGARHPRRREARSSPDRLPQRGLRRSDPGADRRPGCGRGVGLAGRPDLAAFVRVLRPGGRLVVFGRYATLSHGHKNRRAVIEWYASIGALWL